MDIKQYLSEIHRYRAEADNYKDESPGSMRRRLQKLTQARELMGRVSAYMEGEYRRKYAERKRVYAETKRDAPKGDKENTAELAVLDLRDQEAEAYQRMQLWKNEFSSLTEQLYELRLAIRIELSTMNGGID